MLKKEACPLSASVTVRMPVAEAVPSSVTEPVVSPLMRVGSLLPLMVTVMVLLEPSTVVTVRVSTTVFPAPRP